jgi:hypothetical protein
MAPLNFNGNLKSPYVEKCTSETFTVYSYYQFYLIEILIVI